MDAGLRPRLCFLVRGERGYGFHLHGERNRGGQFIRKVEPGSSADLAGLQAGDRLVEVNGVNVENDSHQQVVTRICEVTHRTRLLVVDRETDEYLRSQERACTEDLAIEMGTLSPRPSPKPTPCASPISRENSPLTLKLDNKHFRFPTSETPPPRTPPEEAQRTELAGSGTDTEDEPSPEPEMELLPRLCHLQRGEQGYGFNLHSDKKKTGQFVRTVDPDSPAERAGVRPGDRIVEVNGVNIGGLRHSEVVELIKARGNEVRLLVVDQETDELFLRLQITPTRKHITEVYVDDRPGEDGFHLPAASSNLPTTEALIINVTLADGPFTNLSPKSRANGSSASHSSRSSTTQSEISSSDMSFQVPQDDDRRVSDPFIDSGLSLSPTAAEAKKKVLATRHRRRAPPMDWSKKQELFSNF
ncbi:Na(+)/H(+) exchange regulatory cofactor NHE-RF2 isoform X2 [Oryzias melastigma]|uniref:Na(+)/H(+) exchange regulatory cofactor NHE-RF2 isoform X2 n=1 Tax=Oryzias melastigma TaxID=30732 RepID=UPI000CF7B89B|nr:Na(+)/H(+) exchange regulatory cofactor NHE-RF2 isoform X2 [Oryzias melastigma]